MQQFSITIFATLMVFLMGCNNSGQEPQKERVPFSMLSKDSTGLSPGEKSKGIGRFKEVSLSNPLDSVMIEKGKAIFDSKCIACHKLTEEKLVGPGWKGVTTRRAPEWIMNFITNTEVMLDKDLTAQAEVVTCVVRMPKQDLTDDDARHILEFMRDNDSHK